MKKGGRLPGTASQIVNFSQLADLRGKACEQFAVQRLVREFVGEPLGVFPRDRVVTISDVIRFLLHAAI